MSRLVLVALLLSPLATYAQAYPAKLMRVVIPWPGGSNDAAGRLVFQKVGESVGQPVVIDNRSGAAGTIGAALVARSAPDGYTVMVTSATHIANAHLYRKLPYDTLRDFIGSDKRIRQLADIPTLAEAGVPGYDFTAWVGAFVPAGTSRTIIDKLSAEIRKALDHPDVTSKFNNIALDPMFMTPEQFAARLKADYDKYAALIALTGAKVD